MRSRVRYSWFAASLTVPPDAADNVEEKLRKPASGRQSLVFVLGGT
jgi:hypothetical protein